MTWMTGRRLEWMLRARGTDLTRWPEAERNAAVAMLRRSRAARIAFADVLAEEAAPELDAAASLRMQCVLRRRLAPLPAVVRGMGWSALGACAAAGLYVGVVVNEADPAPDLFTSVQTVTFASLDQ